MQLQQSSKLAGHISLLLAFFSNAQADWSGEVYGGRYYDDERLGSYLVYSNTATSGQTAIAEALYELYTDYEFAGFGGHYLWPLSSSTDAGFVLSQAWESYDFIGYEDIEYQTGTAGIELEFNGDKITLAAQSGKYFSDYDDTDSMYLSADLYLTPYDISWYFRGATRWVASDSLHLIEGYHHTYLMNVPVTAYIGISAEFAHNDTHMAADSVYTGAYLELFSAPSSAMFLWAEVAELDGEALFTIELSLLFGPGARTPYITAFGYSLTD